MIVMKELFEEVPFGNLSVKNRLIRSATAQGCLPTLEYDPERLYHIYSAFAKSGIGTVITSFPLVDMDYYHTPDARENREQVYEKLTAICHAENCAAIAQLVLVNYKGNMSIGDMTPDHIKSVEDMFVTAAARAKLAGYDGVQLHVAHSLFLSRFISPAYNHRNDAYGGSQEGRSKLVTEIIKRIKILYPELHVSMKIDSTDGTPGGLTEEKSLETCLLCEKAGIDSIEVSGSGTSRTNIKAGVNESYFRDYAAKLADRVNVPVILVGGNRSIRSMEQILNSSKIGFMSLSRPLIREPELINRWQNGDTSPAKCISCNMCYQTPWQECIFFLENKAKGER